MSPLGNIGEGGNHAESEEKAVESALSSGDSTDPILPLPIISESGQAGNVIFHSVAGRIERCDSPGGDGFRWVAGELSGERLATIKRKILDFDTPFVPVEEFTHVEGSFAVTLAGPLVPLSIYLERESVRPCEIMQMVLDIAAGLERMSSAGLLPVSLDSSRLLASPSTLGIPGERITFRVRWAFLHDLVPSEEADEEDILRSCLGIGIEFLEREWSAPWHADAAAHFLEILDGLSDAEPLDQALIFKSFLSSLPTPNGRLISDVGKVRANNEDRAMLALESVRPSGCASVSAWVADGMGGHLAGEVASGIALATVSRVLGDWRESLKMGGDVIRSHIESAFQAAENAIAADCELNPSRRGMGTTLTGILVVSPYPEPDPTSSRISGFELARVWVSNLGDSRTYVVGPETLIRLTRDHSLVQDLIDAGELSEEEAFTSPRRNVISRCLGGGRSGDVSPDVASVAAGQGDLFLIASDGLTDLLTDDEIFEIIIESWGESSDPLLHAAERLVEEALSAGGKDNVTLVLIAL